MPTASPPKSQDRWECAYTYASRRGELIIGLISEWMSEEGLRKCEAQGDLGGTMRLGAYPTELDGNSVVRSIYGADTISERHCHRYEVNVHYKEKLEQGGLVLSGMSRTGVA